jgi:hypothetical protein
LQGESGGTVNSTPTPINTTFNNSEIKSSDSSTSSENKDNKGKLANYLSALSGSSPGGSTVERTRSETDSKYSYKYPSLANYLSALGGSSTDGSTVERNRSETDSKYSWKYPSSGDESIIPFDQVATPKLLARILPLSSALPLKQDTYTNAKMASSPSYPPPNFDANLEHIVTVILKLTLAYALALALSQSFVNTFDDFRTIDIDDVHEFRYNTTIRSKYIDNFILLVSVNRLFI